MQNVHPLCDPTSAQLSAGIALPAIRAQREHSIWSRPPPSSPSRYSHSCSWSSCSRQARTTIARDTSTIPMNVGRDERLRPADALGPMAALPTSTSRPSCPQTILWAQCLHAGSLLPAFLAFLVAFLVASACHRLHHTRRTAEGTAEVLVFTPRPAPPPPVPPCGRDKLLGGIVLGRHERFTNRFIGGRSLHGQPHGGVVWRATTACTASWSPACAPVVGVVIAAGFPPHKAGINPWCLHAEPPDPARDPACLWLHVRSCGRSCGETCDCLHARFCLHAAGFAFNCHVGVVCHHFQSTSSFTSRNTAAPQSRDCSR